MTQVPNKCVVVGGGYMGGGIATTIASAGIPCALIDIDSETATRRVNKLIDETRHWVQLGIVGANTIDVVVENLLPARSIVCDIHDAEFVIEAVPEDPSLKKKILSTISNNVSANTTIATNTSTIPIGLLAEDVNQPERFVGCHWMNPARIIPGVEIIPWTGSKASVVQSAVELHKKVGKVPTVVTDSTGFIANRLQHILFAEAGRMVDEGVATPEVIDEVVRNSFGYRLAAFGPFEVADIAGLDVYKACLEYETFILGERFTVPEILNESVEQGKLGLKAGVGITEISQASRTEVCAAMLQYFSSLTDLLRKQGKLEAIRRCVTEKSTPNE